MLCKQHKFVVRAGDQEGAVARLASICLESQVLVVFFRLIFVCYFMLRSSCVCVCLCMPSTARRCTLMI